MITLFIHKWNERIELKNLVWCDRYCDSCSVVSWMCASVYRIYSRFHRKYSHLNGWNGIFCAISFYWIRLYVCSCLHKLCSHDVVANVGNSSVYSFFMTIFTRNGRVFVYTLFVVIRSFYTAQKCGARIDIR